MLRFAHRLVLALIAFAIVGGTTVQRAQPAYYVVSGTVAGLPCDMMMPMADAGHGEAPMAPCNGMTPDCLKQMGCAVDVGLPARLASIGSGEGFSVIDYWSARSAMGGMDRIPEPPPPRTT